MAVTLSALRADRPPFAPQEDTWYLFLLESESPQGHSAAGRIRSTENNLITSSEIEPATFWLIAQCHVRNGARSI
jgi:hypothetical protein